MTLDSGAEPSIITENIIKHVGVKINKSETHVLSDIATISVESIGVIYNLLITLAPSCIIYKDFIVSKKSTPSEYILHDLQNLNMNDVFKKNI
ncbi:15328_t:CDS:2 [Cetraspora pellucida]|uniref:15328_t:CDS:1 n=1 Tax=Cetraspora pellucida TaxID=1433469 RepID=A0A9N8VIJ6_9GLOM|nr:15328_t:CDS:2 [Cetraspora pellucida]